MKPIDDIIDELIPYLIMKESGGNVYAIGDDGAALGILQIRKEVVDDFNRHQDFDHIPYAHRDVYTTHVAIRICKWYLHYYGMQAYSHHGTQVNKETLARIWNGGPLGFGKESTVQYWRDIERFMQTFKIKPVK